MNLYNLQYPKTSEMPRGYDVTFYRILWVSLVVLGLIFTVILTSVFVDIDTLLARQTHAVQKPKSVTIMPEVPPPFEEIQDFPQNEDSDEMDSIYRTKRSLESSNLLFHIKSPKMKKIITNRLATLLEELDEEESSQIANTKGDNKIINVDKATSLNTEDLLPRKEDNDLNKENKNKMRRQMNNKDVFRLAMHNILLQGIIGHMDLNDFYDKVQRLMKSFDRLDNDEKETQEQLENKPKELMKIVSQDSFNEEKEFFDELLKCQKLQKQISQNKQQDNTNIKNQTTEDSPIFIKTVVEITNKLTDEKYTNLNKNVKGIVKLLYNGSPIEVNQLSDNKNVHNDANEINKVRKLSAENIDIVEEKQKTERVKDKNPDLDKAIAEYLQAHSVKLQNNLHLLTKESFETKRLKRQIKIRYLNDGITTERSKLKEKLKKHEEELFVEIETHFDGKGKNGEKKKKLVRSLIDKIQKAINSNIDILQQDTKDNESHVQIKKRTQNPLDHKDLVKTPTIEPVEQRQLNPISKTANVMQPLTSVLDRYGENWKRMYNGPGFLTVAKSLNSAEKSEVDVDYNSVMRNGIPKRLQKPLNTESENVKSNEFSHMGNVTLFLKEIGGSGFSVGINQYMDEPPDKESLKMFTGLENLIQAYHDQYDQSETDALVNESDGKSDTIINNHEVVRRDINRYKRGARNIKLFSNIKTKTRLNKFINTHAMQTKKIFLKNKRNKRHINKIRIVASDHYPRSKENVYLVSHEDIFADRAVIKGDPSEVEIGERDSEHYDVIAPYENPYRSDVPNFQPYIGSVYDTQTLHTGLMSKYPHIFVENISKSKEEFVNIRPTNNENIATEILKTHKYKFDTETRINANDKSIESNSSSPNLDDIFSAILPPPNNYRLTVNILPKNKTNIGPGYKEVHTLINKSYNKNGVRYVSSVNVSEISKFENVNKSNVEIITTTKKPVNDKIDPQQKQFQILLKLHKVRIDHQLENLKIESEKLNEMIGKEDKESSFKNISHIISVFKNLGLKDFEDKIDLPKPNENYTSKTELVLRIPTTITPEIENRNEDTDKNNLINTIKQNENITREILQKINKNTDILQSFLQKVSDKITPENSEKVTATKYENPFEQLHRNLTNSIPFIYAFQKPVQNKDESSKNTASIIYHGHIHTSDIENGGHVNYLKDQNAKTQDSKIFNDKNLFNNSESRFFIDELENDFKVSPNIDNFHSIKVNTTKV